VFHFFGCIAFYGQQGSPACKEKFQLQGIALRAWRQILEHVERPIKMMERFDIG
jgi:hypothetical protein